MARRPSLTEAGVTRPSQTMPPPALPVSDADAKRAAVRQGKKAIACWVDPAAALQLRSAALMEGRTLQAVMEEAIDDWFRKRRLPPIAGSPS
jgi:hypothetical protein